MNHCRFWRINALIAYFGLFTGLILWFTWLAPPERSSISVALLGFVGPLLLPLRGILHGRAYTHAWTSMLALLYFTHGVVEAWSNAEERIWASGEVIFSVWLFTASAFFARCRARQQRSLKATREQTE